MELPNIGCACNYEKGKPHTMAYKYPALSLVRKFFFAFFVVVLHEYWVFQLSYLFFSTTIMIYVVSIYGPYTSRSLNRLQIMFDITFFLLGDLMIAFNGGGWLSTDQNVRF